MSTPLDNARAAWGDSLPDWVEAMAIECGETSQAKVAKLLERSPTLVSQILRNCYPADLSAVEEMFRGVFQEARIECPALGTMPSNECQVWRRKAKTFASGNPTRVRMYRACRACPKNLIQDDAS